MSTHNDNANKIKDHSMVPFILCLLPITDEIRPTLTLTHTRISPSSMKSSHSIQGDTNFCTSCMPSSNNSTLLHLGRNDSTMIHDKSLSRTLATIAILCNDYGEQNNDNQTSISRSHAEYKIIMTVESIYNSKHLQINGIPIHEHDAIYKCSCEKNKQRPSIQLYHNDVISLFKDKYQYKVHCVDPMNNICNNNGKSNQNDVNRNKSNNKHKRKAKQVLCKNEEDAIEAINDNHTNANSQSTFESTTSSIHYHQQQQQQQETITPNIILNPVQIQAQTNILHEMKCPICFEILIETTSSYPCGHLFCNKCIKSIAPPQCPHGFMNRYPHCPSCRKTMEKFTRIRTYDDLIWNIICMNRILFTGDNDNSDEINELRGDIESYLERSGKSIHDLNQNEKECIFGSNFDNRTTSSEVTQVLPPLSLREQRKKLRRNQITNSTDQSLYEPIPWNREPRRQDAILDLTHALFMNRNIDLSSNQQQEGPGATADDPIVL